jgi:hypothetical protein
MMKTIVMSATYRQSSRVTPDLLQRDPENRLLARGPRIRLAPEVMRDQALAVSGLLVEKTGGPPVKPYQPPGLWQELSSFSDPYSRDHGAGLYRRTIYTYWKRTVAPPSMIIFDSPTRETCIVRENRTNTPLQALDLMDDVAYVEAARKFAERMIVEGGKSDKSRLNFGWKLALVQSPEPRQEKVLIDALQKFEHQYKDHYDAARDLLSEGDSKSDRSIDPVELAAYTEVASMILNLDQMVTKE